MCFVVVFVRSPFFHLSLVLMVIFVCALYYRHYKHLSLTHSLSYLTACQSVVSGRKRVSAAKLQSQFQKNGIFYYTKIPMSIGIEKYCPLISAHYKRKRQPKRKADNKQSRHCQHELFIVGLLFSCYKVAMVDILKFFISISFCAFRICFVVTIYW